jgi:hypothetical protein
MLHLLARSVRQRSLGLIVRSVDLMRVVAFGESVALMFGLSLVTPNVIYTAKPAGYSGRCGIVWTYVSSENGLRYGTEPYILNFFTVIKIS